MAGAHSRYSLVGREVVTCKHGGGYGVVEAYYMHFKKEIHNYDTITVGL